MHDRHRDIALFRYSLIREAADPALTAGGARPVGPLSRGPGARRPARRAGAGRPLDVGPLDPGVAHRRVRRPGARRPQRRSAKTPAAMLELAVALKLERPGPHRHAGVPDHRRGPRVGAVAAHRATPVRAPRSERPARRPGPGGVRPVRGGQPRTCCGPATRCTARSSAGRKVYLLAFIDDHSRLLVGYRWCHAEDTVRLEAALRAGLAARGIPGGIYVDNGSAFASKPLLRACASLGIRLTHSTPRRPEGRGKIERFFRTVRDQFLIELDTPLRRPTSPS